MQPRKGDGTFQWNTGGWFGAQVGSTVWMLVLAGLFLPKSLLLSATAFVCFLVPNVVGLTLWSKRDRLAPHPAVQWLMFVIGVASLTAIAAADRLGKLQGMDEQFGSSGRNTYYILLIFPAMMLMFYIQNRLGRRRAEVSPEDLRRSRRIPIRLTTPVKSAEQATDAVITNLSKEGAFIQTTVPFELGTAIDFEITLSLAQLRMLVSGVVRWVKPDEPRGVGLELVEIRAAPAEQSQLYKYLDYIEEIRDIRAAKEGEA